MADPALSRKLGVKDGSTVMVINAPETLQSAVPANCAAASPDVILIFVRDQLAIATHLPAALAAYQRGAVLWFAYPKASGAIRSDMTRDKGWDLLSEKDLLPVSQVAIDADWSALRFRYRDEIRKLTRASDYPGLARQAN